MAPAAARGAPRLGRPERRSSAARCARPYRPSKPQDVKKKLVKLGKSGLAAPASRRRKPFIFKEAAGCTGLILGQAPPGPRQSLPRGWRPLAGPAEQRLAKLAGLNSPSELWARFDRANLLSWYPGLKDRKANHDVAKGYKLHFSDGDIFPMQEACRAASSLDLSTYSTVILLGKNVARAFRVKVGIFKADIRGGTRLFTFPHPSGVSHFWNDAANTKRASKVLRRELLSMKRRFAGR